MIKKGKEMINNLYRLTCLAAFAVFVSCQEPEGFSNPEDPLDAGREFVRAVLDGDFEKASLHVCDNEEDKEIFERYKQYMKKQPKSERLQFKSASIIINSVTNLNDSVTIINFSNSHTMKPADLKVVKQQNEWKVDFSYTFSGNLPAND
ncbi:MAG: hypothetical protein ACK4YE_06725 [Bacteroidota bacterium]|jgi:hypothetical protein